MLSSLFAALAACAHTPQLTELEQDKFALQSSFQEVRQDQRISAELARLYHESTWDQAHETDLKALAARDAERVMTVREHVEARRISSLPDHLHAASLLYRGTHIDDFLLAHELAAAASDAGFRPARAVAARSWDRLKVSRGELQDYGTELRDTDEGLAMVAVSDALTDEDRAAADLPPLSELVQHVLDANGATGDPTLETLVDLGLLVSPDEDAQDRQPLPELTRCADFEGLTALTPDAFAEAGITVDGAPSLATNIDGDTPDGIGVRVEGDESLVIRFDPPIALFRFDVIGVAGMLSVEAWQGEQPLYPESALVLEARSEGWEPGGRAFTTGVPKMADRLVFTSGEPGDIWGLDNLCVGP